MSELLYHYENPKFAGKPWPADGSGINRKSKRRKCVRLCYSHVAASDEAARLRKESPRFVWTFKHCETCRAYHVRRYLKSRA